MNIFKIIKKVLTEPTDFFNKVGAGKQHLGFSFGYFASLSFFSKLMAVIIGLISFHFFLPSFAGIPALEKIMSLAAEKFVLSSFLLKSLWQYLAGLALIFVIVGILHIWIMIFGGKNKYTKTYELVVYAGTPSMLFSWLPYIGMAGPIWSLVLLIIGTQQVHKVSRTKAILMYVIPIVVFSLLAFFLTMLLLPFFIKIFSGALPT